MKFIPHIPDYDRIPHGFCAPEETGCICPVCGEDIRWWAEAWVMKDGYFCHAACVEKEE